MNFIFEGDKTVPFTEIEISDTFLYDDKLYIKIKPYTTSVEDANGRVKTISFNSVCMSSKFELCEIDYSVNVTPIESDLIIHGVNSKHIYFSKYMGI